MKRLRRPSPVPDATLVALLEDEVTNSERRELELLLEGSAELRRKYRQMIRIRELLGDDELPDLDLVRAVRLRVLASPRTLALRARVLRMLRDVFSRFAR